MKAALSLRIVWALLCVLPVVGAVVACIVYFTGGIIGMTILFFVYTLTEIVLCSLFALCLFSKITEAIASSDIEMRSTRDSVRADIGNNSEISPKSIQGNPVTPNIETQNIVAGNSDREQ